MNNSNYINTIYNEENRPITRYPDQLAKYLIETYRIDDGATIIDVGCGRGDFLYAFQRAGLNAIGVDGEDGDGRKDIIGGINLETDALPFDDESVDVVFTKSVMEHLHKPDNMLKECYRILKPGGLIIAMVPDWKTCMYIYYDDHTHVQPYTDVGLRDCLRMFGFSQVNSKQFYQLPVVWKYPIVSVVCRLLRLLGPVKKVYKNKFFRFSRELMLLATGIKE